jgi:serine/threonine-protein kinase RsbW
VAAIAPLGPSTPSAAGGTIPSAVSGVAQRAWTYAARHDAPSRARHDVSAPAAAHGADDETAARVALAVTEAVSNAVLHAYRDEREPGIVKVVAGLADETDLEVLICDYGSGLAPRADSPGLGMGLPLIAASADDCEIRTHSGGGTEVSLRFRLRRSAAESACH